MPPGATLAYVAPYGCREEVTRRLSFAAGPSPDRNSATQGPSESLTGHRCGRSESQSSPGPTSAGVDACGCVRRRATHPHACGARRSCGESLACAFATDVHSVVRFVLDVTPSLRHSGTTGRDSSAAQAEGCASSRSEPSRGRIMETAQNQEQAQRGRWRWRYRDVDRTRPLLRVGFPRRPSTAYPYAAYDTISCGGPVGRATGPGAPSGGAGSAGDGARCRHRSVARAEAAENTAMSGGPPLPPLGCPSPPRDGPRAGPRRGWRPGCRGPRLPR